MNNYSNQKQVKTPRTQMPGGYPLNTVQRLQEIAAKHGGKLLSSTYLGRDIPHPWRCVKGHEWLARPSNVITGTWCPYCAGRHKTIENMQRIADSRGGKCLSTFLVNVSTKLEWECKKGHRWKATPHAIIRKSWCPECGKQSSIENRRVQVSEYQEIARAHGGKLLTLDNANHSKIRTWQCKEGHTWEATGSSVKQGGWCLRCKGVNRYTIDDMKRFAKDRNGNCLSKEYEGYTKKLIWRCERRHEWTTSPTNVLNGTWCPECRSYVNEKCCRQLFEQNFKEKFPERTTSWLKRKNGGYLELDGYCEKLKLAFEYHGAQHYHESKLFNKYSLGKRKQLDRIKRKRCKKNGVTLIEIPYSVPSSEFATYIIKQCKKKHVPLPSSFTTEVDIRTIYSDHRLQAQKDIAESQGGKCLSEYYANVHTPLKWRCKQGHVWYGRPVNIQQGAWCKICTKEKRRAPLSKIILNEMNLIAQSHNGLCLSKNFEKNSVKLQFECLKGHTWLALASNIRRGTWCPRCNKPEKLTIRQMQKIAESRGGRCLSREYVNNHTDLLWECGRGHTWLAIPSSIIFNKTWCATCAGLVRKTIELMQMAAKEKGGKCLSKKYVNNTTKLKWQCKEGHTWEAVPASIQQGKWCRVCANKISADKRRGSLEPYLAIVKKRRGTCLSTTYVNSKTKLKWRCVKGHIWEAVPDSIKAGKWCAKCYAEKTYKK